MTSYQLDDAPRDAPPARLGRYELIGHLATGGMAEIHLARLAGEAGFEKIVVVKRLLPELVASRAFVTMFLDEGKLVARLDHPNVCEVHELGRDGAEYFLVMPFLDGLAVHELIARPREPDRRAELRVATGIIAQACAGLHHAHELRDADGSPAGLVHRDVSPSNLFVTSAGAVKVLDFGVAKVRGAAETEAGTIKGKTQYMAPEQLLGEPLDRRADVFALGIVLFELATHQRLFKRASDYLVAKAILEEPIERADDVDPSIPRAVADVIARALSRDRAARYATAAELATALETAMTAFGGLATPSQIAAAITTTDELSAMRTRQHRVLDAARSRMTAASTPASTPASSASHPASMDAPPTLAERPAAPSSRRRTGWMIGTGVVASAAFVAAFTLRRADQPTRTTDPTSTTGRVIAPGSDSRGSEPTADVRSAATTPPVATNTTPAAGSNTTPSAGSITTPSAETNSNPSAGSITTRSAENNSNPSATDSAKAMGAGNATATVGGNASSGAGTALTRPPTKRGTVSIDSTPFATIYIDGKLVDVTPLLGHSLSEGRHRVRAVLKDGRAKELTIDVRAGKTSKPVTLTW